jgi:two-component system, chemotaxis family, protein-glutamate methylesterase/glutaminase
MAVRDIIVIGASAGGVEVLSQLVRGLPPGFPAALLVVCHIPAGTRSVLPEILSRSGPLLAVHGRDGDPINPGHIYVAPPDHHLLVEKGTIKLTHGPRESRQRPAIDPLFRSAARVYGLRVIGVVLTGALYDGVAGLLAIRAAGGVAVVQDPQDALVAAMPLNASEIAGADYTVPASGLAALLVDLVQRPPPSPSPLPPASGGEGRVRGAPAPEKGVASMTDPLDKLPEVQEKDQDAQQRGERNGAISVFTCPECGGSLWQVDEKQVVHFRCHVGHVYHAEALLAEQKETLEAALWTALRTFKDRAVLSRQLANQEEQRGNSQTAGRFVEQAEQAEKYFESIQRYVLGGHPSVPPHFAGGRPAFGRCRLAAGYVTEVICPARDSLPL